MLASRRDQPPPHLWSIFRLSFVTLVGQIYLRLREALGALSLREHR
jgi:hypothetical protein